MEIVTKGEFSLSYITVKGEPWFKAKSIAERLGYADSKKAISRHIRSHQKRTVEQMKEGGCYAPLDKVHPQTIFINTSGLYRLILRSDLADDRIEAFQDWVTDEVIPSIEKTGSYTYKPYVYRRPNCSLSIQTENDLHYAVVNFLREMKERKHKHIMWHVGLGEVGRTDEIRRDITSKGYMKGSPDLVIINPTSKYAGFALEFKSPRSGGDIADEQIYMIEQYRSLKYKVLISNDLFEIIRKLTSYIKDMRMPCVHCNGKFKTTDTLKNHMIHFHRITSETK
jgi:prophage antirepressor-like protein